MEGKDSRKELYGARACRTLGRNVGAVAEMAVRGIITPEESRDLCARLRNELERLQRQGKMTPHQVAKVEADLTDAAAAAVDR